MTQLDTAQKEWLVMNEKAVDVENGITTATTVDALDYLADYTDIVAPKAAQNPSNFPQVANPPSKVQSHILIKFEGCNGIRMRFLVSDTDGDTIKGTLWGWDDRASAPMDMITFSAITAGTTTCHDAPYSTEYHSATQTMDYLIFTSGGVAEFKVGDTITGNTSSATARIIKVELDFDSSSWLSGVAKGKLFVENISGTFTRTGEVLNNSLGANTATAILHFSDVVEIRCRGSLRHLAFTSGDVAEPKVGETLTSGTGTGAGIVDRVVLTSGSWTANTAAGFIYISSDTGTFEAAEITGSTSGSVFSITTAIQDFRYADTLTIVANGDHCNSDIIGTSAGDGILELRCDAAGMQAMMFDFNVNAAATDGTNGIAVYKFY